MPTVMRVSHAKLRDVRSAVRALLVRVFAAIGVAAGLLWALQRPTPAPSAACKETGGQSIGSCFNETLLSTLIPYLTAMGVGLAVGATIGFLISALMSGRQEQRRPSTPEGQPTTSHTTRGRWITARYNGDCASCGSQIAVGDRVRHRPRRTVCARCG